MTPSEFDQLKVLHGEYTRAALATMRNPGVGSLERDRKEASAAYHARLSALGGALIDATSGKIEAQREAASLEADLDQQEEDHKAHVEFLELRVNELQKERDSLALSTAALIEDTKAPNFVQMVVINPGTGKELVVTIQRRDGKTPGQMLTEAKEELAKVREAWVQDQLKADCQRCRCTDCVPG